ncbi:hypothetical protein MASR2M29_21810 [Spirochaetota bacterium]
MIKKNAVLLLLTVILLASPAFSQDRVDLVIALDSSRSMFTYYNQVIEYVLSALVKEYLRSGDGFHVLSFADKTQVEIAQVLKTEADLKSVIARLYLLYPLGRSTDLISALKNTYRYVADLPESSTKHIILITDGMHAPGEESQYAGLEDSVAKAEIQNAAAKIREKGWDFKILKVPFDSSDKAAASDSAAGGMAVSESADMALGGLEDSGQESRIDFLEDIASSTGSAILNFDPDDRTAMLANTINIPVISFKSDLGTKPLNFSLPVYIQNLSNSDLSVELKSLLMEDGRDILAKKVFAKIPAGKTETLKIGVELPANLKEGPVSLLVEPRFADNLRVSPAISRINFTLKQSLFSSILQRSGIVVLFIALLVLFLALIIAIIFYIRKVEHKSKEPVLGAFVDASAAVAETRSKSAFAPGQNLPLITPAGVSTPRATAKGATAKGAYTPSGMNSQDTGYQTGQDLAYHALAQKRQDLSASGLEPGKRMPAAKQQENLREAANTEKHDAASALAAYRSAMHAHDSPFAKPAEVKAKAELRKAISYSPVIKRAASVRLVLKVEWQNSNIGKRNIKTLHAGGKVSVGGKNSDFFIFLYYFPRDIGHVYFDGDSLTFVPAKMEFFPDYDEAISDCLDRQIRAVNHKGKEVLFSFGLYEAPEVKLNRLLGSIKFPGFKEIPQPDSAHEQEKEQG